MSNENEGEVEPDYDDPYGPSRGSQTRMVCLHCGETYPESTVTYEERFGNTLWWCPTTDCDGAGVGIDIHPAHEWGDHVTQPWDIRLTEKGDGDWIAHEFGRDVTARGATRAVALKNLADGFADTDRIQCTGYRSTVGDCSNAAVARVSAISGSLDRPLCEHCIIDAMVNRGDLTDEKTLELHALRDV